MGILAAIPFITQLHQIQAIFQVEKLRRRKAIALASWLPAQLMWIPMALIPFLVGIRRPEAVVLLLGSLAIRGVMAAVTSTAWNNWARDLVPQNVLGSYFSRRMALATTASIIQCASELFAMFISSKMPKSSPFQIPIELYACLTIRELYDKNADDDSGMARIS